MQPCDNPTVVYQWTYHHPSNMNKVPCSMYKDDAGYDLAICMDHNIGPEQTNVLATGIKIAIPDGYWFRMVGRSSTFTRHGCRVNEAIIDGGYRGELTISVTNTTRTVVHLIRGQRIAQLIPHKIIDLDFVEGIVNSGDTERGDNGYGSTGK